MKFVKDAEFRPFIDEIVPGTSEKSELVSVVFGASELIFAGGRGDVGFA